MRSRFPDLLAAAAIAATMLLLMLSAQTRNAETRKLVAVTHPIEAHAVAVEDPAAAAQSPTPPRPVLRLSRHPRFHERAAVILDATGAPALDPYRGHDGPFQVKLIARIKETAPALAARESEAAAGKAAPGSTRSPLQLASVSQTAPKLATLSPDLSAAATVALSGPAPMRQVSRKARNARPAQRHKPTRPEGAGEPRVLIVMLPQTWNAARQPLRARPALAPAERYATHFVRYRNPSPSDLIMRSLRGPV